MQDSERRPNPNKRLYERGQCSVIYSDKQLSLEVKSITWFACFYMAPEKKEYPVDLRQTVIKHVLNGDSQHEIAQKLIIPRTSVHYIIDKYKKTKCVQTIIGRGQKRKTTVYLDQAIRRKIKADRRKSASSVKAVIETEFGIIISE